MMMRSISNVGRNARRPAGEARPLAAKVFGLLTLGVLALGACGDLEPVTPFEPITDGSKLYGSLALNHRAINLTLTAPYDTIRLTATPRNLLGEPMEGLPAPTFRSLDTVSVKVTADGLVQARRVTAGVQVIAEIVTGDNIRHADTAIVKVVDTPAPPQLGSLEIVFSDPEQAKWPMTTGEMGILADAYFSFGGLPSPGARTVTVDVRDVANAPIPGLEIDYVSLNPDKVQVNRRTGAVEKVLGPPGEQATIVARTTAYGVTKADTAMITVQGPMSHAFLIAEAAGNRMWSHHEVIVRPGAVVSWYYVANPAANPYNVIFSDPTGAEEVTELCTALGLFMPYMCTTGNIAFSGTTQASFRRFNQPGVYDFTVPEHGVTGRVRVIADDDPIWDTARSGR